jgi:diadenosine tetraphosphatase ApaH/serine/threonine PP2A family protein phosphatase
MNSTYVFSSEVTAQYQSRTLYDTFNGVFQWMPLVAILEDQIFCVHGGVAPHAKTIAQLKKIKRPLPSYEGDFVADLVWSDPSQDCKTFDESARGLGVQFGLKTLQDFLSTLKMKMMLRAHQCVQSGIGRFGADLLYTIFSCSRYEGQVNRCGLMFIDIHLQIELFSLPPLDQIPRSDALLQLFERAGPDQEMQISESLALNVKLFDVGLTKPKYSAVRSPQMPGKKESLLQKFAKTPGPPSRKVAKLTRLSDDQPPRAVSADAKRLPRLVDDRGASTEG